MNKLEMKTTDIVNENIKYIQDRFPNAIVETEKGFEVDFNTLKQEMSNIIADDTKEKYQLTWPGKKEAILLANTRTTKTLRPLKEKSVDFDNTENIYIEGDNLEALKILQESYLNKIKCIYIDPPYNTGNDFIYNDNFNKNTNEELEDSGQVDEEGNRLVTNTESNGRFHSVWLSMMYSRLKLARNLLTDDGVIFISIDDNEVHNLRKMCDEIFGEREFLGEFPRVTKKGGKSTDTYAKNHDYVLSYCRNIDEVKINGIYHIDEGYKYKDKYYDARGPYKLNQTLDYNSLQYNKKMDYIIEIEGKKYVPGNDFNLHLKRQSGEHSKHDWVWRWSEKMFDFGLNNGWIVISKSGRIYTKTYLNAFINKNKDDEYYVDYAKRTKPITTLDFVDNQYSNDNSNKEITKIFENNLFDYTKPTILIKNLVNTCVDSGNIILDFFSGSSTTAHAVMQLNAEDGGNRKYIMIQITEKFNESSDAYKDGFETICDIGEERIRRAAKKIKEETNANIDYGFRVYKIDSSNMKDVYYKPSDLEQAQLNLFETNVKDDRTNEDLLTQIILDLGLTLDLKIEEKNILSNKVYYAAENSLVACFDKDIDINIIDEICKCKPLKIVFKEECFNTDNLKINVQEKIKKLSPESEVYVL